MSTSNVLEQLQDLITCKICNKVFTKHDPRSLSCLHTFCFSCIRDIRDWQRLLPSGWNVCCPICFKKTRLADKSPEELPKYFQADQVEDTIHTYQTQKITHFSCNICGNDVSSFCFSCMQSICAKCDTGHSSTKCYKDHVSIKLTRDQVPSLLCKEHGLPFESFCVDCLKSICKQCQITLHKEHNIEQFCIDITTREPYTAEDVQDLNKLQTLQEKFNRQIESLCEEVTLQKETFVKQLEERFNSMLLNIKTKQSQTNISINKKRSQMQDITDTKTHVYEKLSLPLPEFPDLAVADIQGHVKAKCAHFALT